MGGRGGSGSRGTDQAPSSRAVVQVPVVDAEALADLDIRDAYQDVLNIRDRKMGDWVTLLQLRNALSVRGMDKGRQDRELSRFFTQGKGNLDLEVNQKTLTPAVRNAGLVYGGETMHMFNIEP